MEIDGRLGYELLPIVRHQTLIYEEPYNFSECSLEKEIHQEMRWTGILILVAYAVLTSIPVFIAISRRCKEITLINLLSFYLSWTVIGWVGALLWAILGETEDSTTAL